MKKKWNKPGQFKRLLAVLFAAALIIQAVPLQSAVFVTASAEETVEEEPQAETEKEEKTETAEAESSSEEEKKEESSSSEENSEAKSEDASAADSKEEQNSEPAATAEKAEEEVKDTDTSEDTNAGSTEAQSSSGQESTEQSTTEQSTEQSSEQSAEQSTEQSDEKSTEQSSSSEGTSETAGENASTADTGQKDAAAGSSAETAGSGDSNDSTRKDSKETSDQDVSDEPARKTQSVKTEKSNEGETVEPEAKFEGYKVDGDEAFANSDKKEAYVEKAITLKYSFSGEDGTYLEYRQVEKKDAEETDKKYAKLEKNADNEYVVVYDGKDEVCEYVQVRAVYEKSADEKLTSEVLTFRVVIDTQDPSINATIDPSDVKIDTATNETLTISAAMTDSLLEKVGEDKYSFKYVITDSTKTDDELAALSEGWEDVPEEGISVSSDGKGYVYLMAKDSLGHTVYQLVTPDGFFIDSTAPTVSLESSPDGTKKECTVTVSAEDPKTNEVASGLAESFSYELTQGETKKTDGTVSFTDGKGTIVLSDLENYQEYTLKVTVKDQAGNSVAATADVELIAPSLEVDSKASDEQEVTKSSVAYTVTASDNSGKYTVYSCVVDKDSTAPAFNAADTSGWTKAGTEEDASDGKIEVTFSDEGEKDVYFAAADDVGNASDVVQAKSYLIDKTAPAVTLTSDTTGANKNFKVTITAQDNKSNGTASGLAGTYSYVLKQGNEKKDEGSGTLTDGKADIKFNNVAADGDCTLTVTVKDNAGNEGQKGTTLDFDQTAPAASITIDQSETRKDDTGTYHYTSTDLKTAEVTFKKTKGNGVLSKVSVILVPAEGIADSKTYTYSPEINVEDKKKEITVSLSDVIGDTEKIGDGTWTVYAYAEDSSGNSTGNTAGAGDGENELASVIVDDTAPVLTLSAPVCADGTSSVTNDGKTYYNGSVTVTAAEDSSKEAENEKLTWTVGTETGLAEGEATLSPSEETGVAEALSQTVFTAKDLAGNEASVTFQKSGEEKYYFDVLAPTISYTASDKGTLVITGNDTYDYEVTVTDGTLSCGIDAASIQYAIVNSDDATEEPADTDWVDAGAAKAESGAYTFTVSAPKKGLVHIRAYDRLNNGPATDTANILVMENEKPVITQVDITTKKADSEEETETYKNPSGNIDMSEMPVNGFKVSVTAEDKPDDAYSGLKSITYELKGTTSDGSAYESTKTNALGETPSKLSDLVKSKKTDAEDLKTLFGFEDDPNGTFTLSISVTDYCGNTSDVQTIGLCFDNTDPEISVDIDASASEDYPTYHNADNSKVTVVITETNISEYTINVGKLTFTNDTEIEGVTKETSGSVTTVTFPSDVVAEGNEDGEISVTASVTDKANNNTDSFSNADAWKYLTKKSEKEATFTLDTTVPEITVDIDAAALDQHKTFHKADNSTVTVVITETNVSEYTINVGDLTVKNDTDLEGVTKETEDNVTTVTFPAAVVCSGNQDGYVSITASVTDKAINSTDKFSNADEWEYLEKVSSAEARFTLDTTIPVIKTITTNLSSTGGEAAADKLRFFDNLYYFSEDQVDLVYEIEEVNYDETLVITAYDKNGSAVDDDGIAPNKNQSAFTVSFTEEATYENIQVSGQDKAGNLLTLASDYAHNVECETAADDSAGTIAMSSGYVIDRTAPVATITYTTDGKKKTYAYNEELVSGGPAVTAYYSGDITPDITIKETNTFDNQTLEAYSYHAETLADVSGAQKELTFNPDGTQKWDNTDWTVSLDKLTGNSDYAYYTLKGKDRAGNALIVNESFAEGQDPLDGTGAALADSAVKEKDTNGNLYTSKYLLVIDKVVPQVTLQYTVADDRTGFVYDDQKHASNDLAAYISGNVTVNATVDDINTDLDRLWYVNPGADSAQVWTQAADMALAATTADGQYLYSVYGVDKAGNAATVTEKFADGTKLEYVPVTDTSGTGTDNTAITPAFDSTKEGCEKEYTPYYVIIIDTTSPAVTKIVTNDQKKEKDENEKEVIVAGDESDPPYYEDDETFYYNPSEGMRTVYTIVETNYDVNRVSSSYEMDGTETAFDSQATENTYTITFTDDATYTAVTMIGTDRAGNHLVLGDAETDAGKEAADGNPSQNDAEVVTAAEADDYGLADTTVVLSYDRILDRVSPVAVVKHVVPDNTTGYLYPEVENGSTATMYSKNVVTTTFSVSDTYGDGTAVLLDGEKLTVKKHFRKAGETFKASAAEQWAKEPGSKDALETEVKTSTEGHYTYSISGTDRAGNAVIVQEALKTNKDKKAVVNSSKGKYDGEEPVDFSTEDETFRSFYALVYDCTAPVYRFTINNPSNLDETFDEKTNVAYYGKSISAIKAKYVVKDNNFDDTRVLAAITSKSASGVNNMDALYPAWVTPATQGSTSEKDGLTTATFSLPVDVDSQHEGMYRFEIEGCDKAGNYLAKSSEQAAVDSSTARADLAAATLAKDASKGKFWTYRKAVDVTAPKGVLKVRSSKGSSDNYYEIKFDAGSNTPVKYEPFRKETSAYVIVESDDCSPTMISYNLRSQDSSKDASYKSSNPIVSTGTNTYKNDNTRDVTVNGEQAFYLENILIKDRAGNVRANDSKSKYTMAKSNNVYLDVTTPVVSKINDAESPQVKIIADGSFTRHEADGERYIYKPDGSALDLKVSINDPGGEARSSGLQKVEVEVTVGGETVTGKVNLSKIPYTYSKGSSDSHNPLVYDINDATISIPTGGFAESNDITIKVTATDNSGNVSTPSKDGGLLNLGIDTTAPKVEVNYHDTAEPQHDKYFKADRVVEIVVIDRNVDNSKINIDTNTGVPGSFTAPHGNKTTDAGGEAGNEDRWTKTLTYDQDLDYTLQISGTDALGNRISDIKWNGPAPNEFTVDKTAPKIRINLPTAVNDVNDVKYYDNPATAIVEIEEHNFFEETDSNLLDVTIEPSNHSGAEAPANPGRSGFSSSGDVHRSEIDCSKDGDYEITASYTDMAGNEAIVDGGEGSKSDKQAWSTKFVIDTVVPVLKMDPDTFNVDETTGDPKAGLENQIYTKKNFAPRVIINDINYDQENSNFDVKAYGANVSKGELTVKDGDADKGEYNIQFKDFEMVRDMDGVYKVTAVATDYAKHQATLDFMFSVNRFGSTYVYADDPTENKVDRYYINNTDDPLKILELTPVQLKSHQVEMFKDHNRSTLTEDAEYTFDNAKGATKVGTSGEGHRVYEYSIAPEVFEEEGVYDFILSSTDAAGNENSTALFRDGSTKDNQVESVKFPIEFQVDKTVPVNRLTGVETEKEQFNANELEIMVYPEDAQTDIGEVEIKVYDGNRNGTNATEDTEKYRHYRYISEDENAEALAKQNIYPIEEAKEGISVVLEDKGSWQLLEVITTDLAGNVSNDYRTGDSSVNLPDTRRRFLVTTNPLIQFYNFKPAFYGSIGGVALLLLLLMFLKRKKDEKESGAN